MLRSAGARLVSLNSPNWFILVLSTSMFVISAAERRMIHRSSRLNVLELLCGLSFRDAVDVDRDDHQTESRWYENSEQIRTSADHSFKSLCCLYCVSNMLLECFCAVGSKHCPHLQASRSSSERHCPIPGLGSRPLIIFRVSQNSRFNGKLVGEVSMALKEKTTVQLADLMLTL